MTYEFTPKTGILYPSEAFDDFECIMSGELVTIVAESNSGKTTFALDLIRRNADNGIKGYYINLEFPMETMWQSRWLWFHGKSKTCLTDLSMLTPEEQQDMQKYVTSNLNKFKYYSSPNGMSIQKLEQLIYTIAMEGFKLVVIDSFSMIHGNSGNDARGNQNKCMQTLQELAQDLDLAIIVLHHTNRTGTREGSQKIMDLSNVMIVISKEKDAEGEEYRNYSLIKDKYVTNRDVDVYYRGGRYERF